MLCTGLATVSKMPSMLTQIQDCTSLKCWLRRIVLFTFFILRLLHQAQLSSKRNNRTHIFKQHFNLSGTVCLQAGMRKKLLVDLARLYRVHSVFHSKIMHGSCCLIEFGWPLSSSLPSTSLDIVVAASRLSALEPLCGCITWQIGLIWDPYSNLAFYSKNLNTRNKVFHMFFPTNILSRNTASAQRENPSNFIYMFCQPWSTKDGAQAEGHFGKKWLGNCFQAASA